MKRPEIPRCHNYIISIDELYVAINELSEEECNHPKHGYNIEQLLSVYNTSVNKIVLVTMYGPGQCVISTTNSYMWEKPETISIDPTYRRWFVLLIGLIPIIFLALCFISDLLEKLQNPLET